MSTTSGKNGFADVDRSDNPQSFVNCLNEQYSRNSILRLNKQRTLELADIQRGHIVLDAGCGTGTDAIQMAALVGPSGHVFGIDLSQEMIASAKGNSADLNLPLTFRQGNIYQPDFEDNFFNTTL